MYQVNADSTVIEHVGGHIMSGRKDHGLLVRDFLTKQLEKITEEEELKRLAAEQDVSAVKSFFQCVGSIKCATGGSAGRNS